VYFETLIMYLFWTKGKFRDTSSLFFK